MSPIGESRTQAGQFEAPYGTISWESDGDAFRLR